MNEYVNQQFHDVWVFWSVFFFLKYVLEKPSERRKYFQKKLFSSAVVFQNLIFLNIFLLEKSEAIKLQLNTREGHYLDICTHLISSMHFYLIFYTIWNCNQCIKLVINTWIYNWNVEKLGLSVSFLFIHT